MLLANFTYPQIAQQLGLTKIIIRTDVIAIYRAHRIQVRGSLARKRALAHKLGLNYTTKSDHLAAHAAALREQGLTWKEVARELGIPVGTAYNFGRKSKNQTAPQMTEAGIVA
jgi:hypothetical protein